MWKQDRAVQATCSAMRALWSEGLACQPLAALPELTQAASWARQDSSRPFPKRAGRPRAEAAGALAKRAGTRASDPERIGPHAERAEGLASRTKRESKVPHELGEGRGIFLGQEVTTKNNKAEYVTYGKEKTTAAL